MVILISAFSNRLENGKRNDGEAYPDFFKYKINTYKIQLLSEKFIVMHSNDDDSIPYEQGVGITKDLDAKLITFSDRGHFYKPENAPYILEVLRKELNF